MTEQTFGKNYSQFVNALVFIFPIVINSVKVAGDIVLFILAVMGIFITISQRLSPFSIKDIKVFSYLTSGYFLSVCLSVLFSGKVMELAHFIPRDFHFLFAPFIALALYKAEINVNYLLTGVKVGLIVLGIIVINQSGFPLSVASRPWQFGVMNSGVFANLTVSMFFVVIVFFQQESFSNKVFTFFLLLSSFFMIVASGTRSAWVTFLLLLCIYLYFLYKQNAKSSKLSNFFLAFTVVTIVSVGCFNQYVNDRVHLVSTQASNWLSGSGDKAKNSISVRLEMYKRAINNAKDVPFFGYGYRTSNLVLFKNSSYYFEKSAMSKNHLHNAYLTNFYNGGIVLLVALLFLLFVPIIIFIKEMRQNRDKPVLIAGLLLTVGFVSHGMFSVLMGDVFMNAFYVFFLAIFLHLTAKSTKIS